MANTINKSKGALHGIKFIKPYFKTEELRQIITSIFFQFYTTTPKFGIFLHYGNHCSKQQLLAASASALILCTPGDTG